MNKVKKQPLVEIAEEIISGQELEATVETATVAAKPAARKKRSSNKFLKGLNVFGLLEKDVMIKVLPFVFFLTFIALVYIANSYYAEKTIREIDKSTKELKELRSEYISTKTELMNKSKQSQIAVSVLPMGLKESRVAPRKILVAASSVNKEQ